MKIALPVVGGKLSMHFGHCDQFALVDVDEANKQVVNTAMLAPPAHEPGVLPRWLHEQGAELIIAGGIGRRAQQLFADQGIRVIVGAPSESPDQVVAAYLNGNLALGDNICDH